MTFADMTCLNFGRFWPQIRAITPPCPALNLTGVLMLSVALLGCQGLGRQGDRLPNLGMPLPIAQIQEHPVAVDTLPQGTVGQGFTVEGTVTEVAPLATGAAYALQDATGGIWVVTTAPAPAVGSTVRVQGQLSYETILVAGQDRGEHYLQEQQRTLVAPPEESGDATDSDPAEPESSETDPLDADPSTTEPAETDPLDADPAETEASPTPDPVSRAEDS